MRYHNITKDDMLNGDGLRVVLWVSGCSHCCKECQNPVTWDPNSGILFDESAKQEIFEQLESKIESHILEKSIPAQTVFDVDDRIKEGTVNIPIMSLEKALKLYLDIKNQHADYIQQFYFAVAGILNQNCQCLTGISDDEDLPF